VKVLRGNLITEMLLHPWRLRKGCPGRLLVQELSIPCHMQRSHL